MNIVKQETMEELQIINEAINAIVDTDDESIRRKIELINLEISIYRGGRKETDTVH